MESELHGHQPTQGGSQARRKAKRRTSVRTFNTKSSASSRLMDCGWYNSGNASEGKLRCCKVSWGERLPLPSRSCP